MTAWRTVLALLLAMLAGVARAQTFPEFTGFVVDAANVLPPDVEEDLTAKLDALQRDTKRQLVVATVPDLQGYPIEDYGYRLGRAWGVGLQDVDNGAILLVAPNERKVRVEVGYGLEPFITDALSSVIVNQRIVPRFKAGDLPGGVVAGTDALVQQLRASPEEAQARLDAAVREFDRTNRAQTRRGGGGGFPVSLIFWGMIFLFVVLQLMRGRRGGRLGGRRYRGGGSSLPIVLWAIGNEIGRSRGGWGGGGFGGGSGGGGWGGGGFSGGGGGSFGGGGASGELVMHLTEADHKAVSAAVAAAEARTDGEIVTVVARRSDAYHDVALHWAVLAMLGVLALLAAFPWIAERLYALVDPWATRTPLGGLFTVALVLAALTFLLARLLLAPMRLRIALTPGSTEARRVHRRALELFRASAEHRTKAKTGVLLYLSLAEHRAEIVADEAIHSRVAPELWGEAMAVLLERTRAGRPGEGIAAAVERIGSVLAEHFPRSEGDTNELPDRLVEL